MHLYYWVRVSKLDGKYSNVATIVVKPYLYRHKINIVEPEWFVHYLGRHFLLVVVVYLF